MRKVAYSSIAVSLFGMGMVICFVLDIIEVLHNGIAFGYVFGAIGTLLKAGLHWKNNRSIALSHSITALIFAFAAVVCFLK